MRTAVVHPVHGLVLRGVKEAADAGFIVPVLVGPKAKIDSSAEAEGLDLGRYECVYTEHSHEAAARAVALDPPQRVGCALGQISATGRLGRAHGKGAIYRI